MDLLIQYAMYIMNNKIAIKWSSTIALIAWDGSAIIRELGL
jgi:hypothetical protein